MRLLHTSDWHLGRSLEGRSRLDEQQQFIAEMCQLADSEAVDLVLIAGDVFDTANPPAKAEQLFYQGIYELSAGGRRGVLVIAGNHDHPERIKASVPLAEQLGITILGLPQDQALITPKPLSSQKESRVRILAAGAGWLELAVPGCDHTAVIITLPYPSEQRLKEVLVSKLDEAALQKSYSERVGAFFSEKARHYRSDTVNLCTSHLFVRGSKESESERPIQLGGACTVDREMLPQQAQYIALGHLHRAQKVGSSSHIRYAGSPLSHSFSETGQAKVVYIVDCLPGKEAVVQEVPLTSGKTLVRWLAKDGLAQASQWCAANKDVNSWLDLQIHVPQPLQQHEIKALRELRPQIINIRPVLPEMAKTLQLTNRSDLPVQELFSQFYYKNHQVAPPPELVQLFLELVE